MNTDDLRSKYGKQVTKYNKVLDDDLWTDDYVLWLEKQLLSDAVEGEQLCDLDGKKVLVKFKVNNNIPKFYLD